MLCYFRWLLKTRTISPTVALPRKTSVADNAADAIYHSALLSNNTAGLTLGALAGITTTAVGAAAVVTVTTRVGHSIY